MISEELIVRQCSPTLAGLKTAGMFSCEYDSRTMLLDQIRSVNRRLSGKGLIVIPLRIRDGHALIYMYRPAMLKNDLKDNDTEAFLCELGYNCKCPAKCLSRLISKISQKDTDAGFGAFPHEIGLFLGYPSEDVLGFIRNRAGNSKMTGAWKVYGDKEKAERIFEKYRKCTRCYLRRLKKGSSIEQLTVAV